MANWIFKLANQSLYADQLGEVYVFDNTHSVRVTTGDNFIYLDKRGGIYGFTGHGVVAKLKSRAPNRSERRHDSVRLIYTATLGDYVQYHTPLDIHPGRREGRRNRTALGISNVNKLGWSVSVAKLQQSMLERIIEHAYRARIVEVPEPELSDHKVLDTWSFVRTRHNQERFKETVLNRQNHMCAVCGTTLREVMEVAHVSTYASDIQNRANPANGIGLCAFCHRAFDRKVFLLTERGEVLYRSGLKWDQMAEAHMAGLSEDARLRLLDGVDKGFLRMRLSESLPDQQFS